MGRHISGSHEHVSQGLKPNTEQREQLSNAHQTIGYYLLWSSYRDYFVWYAEKHHLHTLQRLATEFEKEKYITIPCLIPMQLQSFLFWR